MTLLDEIKLARETFENDWEKVTWRNAVEKRKPWKENTMRSIENALLKRFKILDETVIVHWHRPSSGDF